MNMKNKKFNLATFIFALGALVAGGYFITYWFAVTDNAFVIESQTPISASISGHIQKIYVENGQLLKKGDPILLIRPDKYKLDYAAVKAQYDQALIGIEVLQKRIQVTRMDLRAAEDQLARLNYEYKQKNDKSVKKGVPQLEIKNLQYNIKSQEDSVASLKAQIALEQTEIKQAKMGIKTLKANTDIAAISVEDTVVRAPSDGYVQNLYFGEGTSAVAHEGLCSFVNTANTYIQANFNETDLANVRSGDKVLIYPRTYLWHKVFHGVVMSDNWTSDRQHIIPLKSTQFVMSENHWLNLPQRLPVQIKVLDSDPKYPLRPGMSTYVYIQTK